jgi:Leucine-rich repeat (LRR) protein
LFCFSACFLLLFCSAYILKRQAYIFYVKNIDFFGDTSLIFFLLSPITITHFHTHTHTHTLPPCASWENTQGPLPDMSDATNLAKLTAQNNKFTGPLFDVQKLTSLTQFRVQNNLLTGPLPSETELSSSKTKLRYFQVQNNQLTGSLPSNMVGFTALQYLRVDGCNVSSLVPSVRSGIIQMRLNGPGNFWYCPFPVPLSTVSRSAIALLNCTCMPGSSCNDVSSLNSFRHFWKFSYICYFECFLLSFILYSAHSTITSLPSL